LRKWEEIEEKERLVDVAMLVVKSYMWRMLKSYKSAKDQFENNKLLVVSVAEMKKVQTKLVMTMKRVVKRKREKANRLNKRLYSVSSEIMLKRLEVMKKKTMVVLLAEMSIRKVLSLWEVKTVKKVKVA
jgi:hypothetical protein